VLAAHLTSVTQTHSPVSPNTVQKAIQGYARRWMPCGRRRPLGRPLACYRAYGSSPSFATGATSLGPTSFEGSVTSNLLP